MKILNDTQNKLNIDIDIFFNYAINTTVDEAIASIQFDDPDNILDTDVPDDFYNVSNELYLWQKDRFTSFCDNIEEWVSDLIEPNSLMKKFERDLSEKENIKVVMSKDPLSIETCYIHFVTKSTKSSKPPYYVTIRISSHGIINKNDAHRTNHKEYWKNYFEVKQCIVEQILLNTESIQHRYKKFIDVLNEIRYIIEEHI